MCLQRMQAVVVLLRAWSSCLNSHTRPTRKRPRNLSREVVSSDSASKYHATGTVARLAPWLATTQPVVCTTGFNTGSRSGELRTQKLKSPLMRTQSLKVLSLKPGVGQYIAKHATLTARDVFLANFYPSGPFTSIFFQNLCRVFSV